MVQVELNLNQEYPFLGIPLRDGEFPSKEGEQKPNLTLKVILSRLLGKSEIQRDEKHNLKWFRTCSILFAKIEQTYNKKEATITLKEDEVQFILDMIADLPTWRGMVEGMTIMYLEQALQTAKGK